MYRFVALRFTLPVGPTRDRVPLRAPSRPRFRDRYYRWPPPRRHRERGQRRRQAQLLVPLFLSQTRWEESSVEGISLLSPTFVRWRQSPVTDTRCEFSTTADISPSSVSISVRETEDSLSAPSMFVSHHHRSHHSSRRDADASRRPAPNRRTPSATNQTIWVSPKMPPPISPSAGIAEMIPAVPTTSPK